MNRLSRIRFIRTQMSLKRPSIGSWMQLPHASVAEIIGSADFDWVAVDMEHGAISVHQLPDIFRALELAGALPLARLAQAHPKDCKQVLDAGAGGVIVPMIENADQLINLKDACRWPPSGKRGVGFSRANLFGKYFDTYFEEAQMPLLIAMIENYKAVSNLSEILAVNGLDAILIGPYDLSASMGLTGEFESPEFIACIDKILKLCNLSNIPCGIHIIKPDPENLKLKINEGYLFLAYSIDSVMLSEAASYATNSNIL